MYEYVIYWSIKTKQTRRDPRIPTVEHSVTVASCIVASCILVGSVRQSSTLCCNCVLGSDICIGVLIYPALRGLWFTYSSVVNDSTYSCGSPTICLPVGMASASTTSLRACSHMSLLQSLQMKLLTLKQDPTSSI